MGISLCLHPVACTVIFVVLDDLSPTCTSLLATGTSAAIILSTSLDAPIEDVVVLVSFANEEIAEEFAKVRIVRLVVEAKSTGIVEENSELVWEAAAEEIGRSSHFFLHNTIVFLLLSSSFEPLPREGTAEEVHKHVGEGFKVVTAGLLNAQVGVDGRVPRRSGQVLVLPVRDVKMGLRVPELLRETEIDDVDLVATLTDPHEEVVGLDIPVDEVSRVDVLDAGDLWKMA